MRLVAPRMTLALCIDIWSDNVCPWCFVGKRNLEAALQQAPDVNAKISWHAFFLNVNAEDTSTEPITEHLMRKYGAMQGRNMAEALRQAGTRTGINFNENRYVHNTIKSHRLVRLADVQNLQGPMIEAIFSSYFEGGVNLSDTAVLCDIASRVGVTGAKEFLESKEEEEEVLADYQQGVGRFKISGVPYFVISQADDNSVDTGMKSRAVVLSGAQPPEAFLQAFQKLR
jgi:predicted DsbA family dithiol-disulfide isomerase